ncbi:hypothetical protein ACHAXA_011545 [Cyclostephanos tholiformis]|uniref:Uncharacterized protein n=1 Tax=Cyclostephanos tholiformis TaxID=382380 RepID=A0ABD3RZN9_9STRA
MAPADDPFACFGDSSSSDDEVNHDDSLFIVDGHDNNNDEENDDRDRARRLVECYNAAAAAAAAAAAERHRSTKRIDLAPKDAASSSSSSSSSSLTSFHSSFEDQTERTSHLPWPQNPPLYLGPMKLSYNLEEAGGGRGYVASRDLPPGTLILVEEPLVEGWSERQLGRRLGMESIKHIMERKDANVIVRCMEELHPTRARVNDVLRRRRRRIRDENIDNGEHMGSSSKKRGLATTYDDNLDEAQIANMISIMERDANHVKMATLLVSYATERSVTNSDGSSIDMDDLGRMLLALRYNGFDSGLYLHFSMFNHAEGEWREEKRVGMRRRRRRRRRGRRREGDAYDVGDGTIASQQRQTRRNYSEARTTRYVHMGEALTLHYVENPREVSHATRRRMLWDQHRFDIGDEHDYRRLLDINATKTGHLYNDNERGRRIFESELVRGKFPASIREGKDPDNDDASRRDHHDNGGGFFTPTTQSIERSLDELENSLVELQGSLGGQSSNDAGGTHFDRVAALEFTIGELIAALKSAFGNDKHILLSRCYRLHLDVVEVLLKYCASELTRGLSFKLVARSLPSAASLLESRRLRLGNDHTDLARTYHDLAMGIRVLLSNAPRMLLSLRLEGMSTLDDCSRMEHRCRSERDRIDRLYPRDVNDILERIWRK